MYAPEYSSPSPHKLYEENHAEIIDTLAAIKQTVEAQHTNDQPKTWDDVSTQNDILEALGNVTRLLDI